MNTLLLIFFALPIAVVIISIALQKIFRNPFLVAAIIFAIFLVVTFIVGDLIWLVATIAYTILAFITAVLTKIICKIIRQLNEDEENNDDNEGNGGCPNGNTGNGTQVLSITGETLNNQENLNVYPNYDTTERTRGYCNYYRR